MDLIIIRMLKMIFKCQKKLQKSFSIICGDDYELDFNPRLLEIAKKSIDNDFIETEYGAFHPGVFLLLR